MTARATPGKGKPNMSGDARSAARWQEKAAAQGKDIARLQRQVAALKRDKAALLAGLKALRAIREVGT